MGQWDSVGDTVELYSLRSADERLFQTMPELLSSPHTHWGHQTLKGVGGKCLCLILTQSGSTHLRNALGYPSTDIGRIPYQYHSSSLTLIAVRSNIPN